MHKGQETGGHCSRPEYHMWLCLGNKCTLVKDGEKTGVSGKGQVNPVILQSHSTFPIDADL